MLKKLFGTTKDGRTVHSYTLENSLGICVTLLDYGATIQSIIVPDKNGNKVDIVLGHDSIANYEADSAYFGAVIGRVANRIANATFELNGKTYTLAKNNGEHCLHGGNIGFDKHIFDVEEIAPNVVKFSRLSPDMEEGFPGNLEVSVTYTLTDEGEIKLDYYAKSDADTLVNLTNHVYFNLDGQGNIYNNTLEILCDKFCETDPSGVPTGKFLDVSDTAFDFRKAKLIGQDLFSDEEQIQCVGGYDHNIPFGKDGIYKKMADVKSTLNSIGMEVFSDMPGIQFYSGNFLTEKPGKDGSVINKHSGFCLETQHYPDSIHNTHFPSDVLKAGEEYKYVTTFKIYNF